MEHAKESAGAAEKKKHEEKKDQMLKNQMASYASATRGKRVGSNAKGSVFSTQKGAKDRTREAQLSTGTASMLEPGPLLDISANAAMAAAASRVCPLYR